MTNSEKLDLLAERLDRIEKHLNHPAAASSLAADRRIPLPYHYYDYGSSAGGPYPKYVTTSY